MTSRSIWKDTALGADEAVAPVFTFTAPADKSTKINWTAIVTAESDTNPANDEATATTKVKK